MGNRYSSEALRQFAKQLLLAYGLAETHAIVTADVLVEADLLGHRTHGIDLLPVYASLLEEGKMARSGTPEVIADRGANLIWDGQNLPGQSLVTQALQEAVGRVKQHGVVTVVIRKSQHTGCHAAYLTNPVARGVFVLLTAANSHGQRIAPFGGLDPVFSPSPFAVGIPSSGDPILIDMTMASTANSVCRQHHQRQERLPHAWLQDASGMATDDPATLYNEPKSTILPLGGVDNGHKGFGLILFIEALTLALSGGSHTENPEESSQSVFLQIIDPDAFGGLSSFREQIDWIMEACQGSRPAPGVVRPRLPGEVSLALRREQEKTGVEVAQDIRHRLEAVGDKAGVRFPEAISR